jgi:hypothetical protein
MASSGRLAYAVNFGDHVKIKAGCFWDTTEVLRERVKNDPKRQDYLLFCDWAEKRFLGGIKMIDYLHAPDQGKKREEENRAYVKAIKALLERKRELPLYMTKALEQELERMVK